MKTGQMGTLFTSWTGCFADKFNRSMSHESSLSHQSEATANVDGDSKESENMISFETAEADFFFSEPSPSRLAKGRSLSGSGDCRTNSSILACLGRNDESCSNDLEVLLGSVAPCVLYGSNAERLGSAPRTLANHCLPYSLPSAVNST
ncbi:hypothetical protein ACFX2B_013859 [Malus domestica]